jgi:hypothetical protein
VKKGNDDPEERAKKRKTRKERQVKKEATRLHDLDVAEKKVKALEKELQDLKTNVPQKVISLEDKAKELEKERTVKAEELKDEETRLSTNRKLTIDFIALEEKVRVVEKVLPQKAKDLEDEMEALNRAKHDAAEQLLKKKVEVLKLGKKEGVAPLFKAETRSAVEEGVALIDLFRVELKNLSLKNLSTRRRGPTCLLSSKSLSPVFLEGEKGKNVKNEGKALGEDCFGEIGNAKNEVMALGKGSLDEMEALLKEVLQNFYETFKTSIGKIKKKLVDVARKETKRKFTEGYAKIRKYWVFRKVWNVTMELDTYELNRHLREVEQVSELVQGLFDLELKVENLDEVSDRWWLLCDLTSTLKCKDVYYCLVELLWSNDGVREAMTISKLFSDCQAPYPSDAVRLFKSKAAKHLRTNYTKIVARLRKTNASIQHLKRMKQQASAIMTSGICAFFIGVAKFMSTLIYATLEPSLGLSASADIHSEEQVASRMLVVDVDVDIGENTYGPTHADTEHAAGAASKPVVLDVLMQMLQQQEDQIAHKQFATEQQQRQLTKLTQQQQDHMAHQKVATEQQQRQLTKLTRQHQEHHTEQCELLASIESAVVPACLEAVVHYVADVHGAESELNLRGR